jgi:hypothetical protein
MTPNHVSLGGEELYASADAARIGGGLYLYILNALVQFVSDPSPMVAVAAREVRTWFTRRNVRRGLISPSCPAR